MLLCIYTLCFNSHLFSQTCDTMTVCGCASNDPTPVGVMISHVHAKNEWMISYKYMNMGMNGIISGTAPIDNATVFEKYLYSSDKMRMDMHMLMLMYGITNKISSMVMLNYNVSTMNMNAFTASVHNHSGTGHSDMNSAHTMKTSGISDIKLYMLYGLIKETNYQLLLSTGFNIPVGSINIKGKSDDIMYPDKRYPYTMQMGSGTVDVLPCINYLYQKEKTSFSTQISSVVRTGYNTLGYKLGNEISFGTWFAYQWLNFINSSVRIEGVVTEKITGYDPALYTYNEPSANPFNYGGEKVNCYIGSLFQIKQGVFKNNRLGVEYGIPVYQNMNGIQMKQTHAFHASWSIAF